MTTFFFVTLTNCDLNMYNHIPYKPLQDCDYKPKISYKTMSLCWNKGVNCLNFLYGLI
jgi:hypothetical protein